MGLTRKTLTDQEFQIMTIVWKCREATVRDVYEEMRTRRRVAYTTVMTMMNILKRKDRLRRRRNGRAFVYTPVHSKEQVVIEMLQEFVDRIFDGSVSSLLEVVKTMPSPRLKIRRQPSA
jgi:BlaI family penicillinase repressor